MVGAINWHPGIGDPDLRGWTITVAYLAACAACALAWRRERSAARLVAAGSDGRGAYTPAFWLALALGMAFLGINKQLDLQTLLTEIGKDAAKSQGWYERRRAVQYAFAGLVAVVAAAAFAYACWSLRGRWRRYLLAIVGVTYLLGFVVLRAASMQHVDRPLGVRVDRPGLNLVLELGGALFLLLAATRAALTTPHPASPP